MTHRRRFEWRGPHFCRAGTTKPVICIVPDPDYAYMWRVHRPDRTLTDIVNLARA